jgi:NhaP-type Na+/H+ or K+/H+ antiporter
MEQLITTETLVIELLLVVTLVAIAVRRLRIPYTVALVVVGLALTIEQPLDVTLAPELILALFLPPLAHSEDRDLGARRLLELQSALHPGQERRARCRSGLSLPARAVARSYPGFDS